MTTSQVTRPAVEGVPAAAAGWRRRLPVRRPAGLPRWGGTAPGRLGARAVVALLLLAALCAAGAAGAVDIRRQTGLLRTEVAERAAVAAQVRFALADLDAQRADTLVPGRSAADPGVDVGNQLNALITAQRRRREVSELLRRLGADRERSGHVRTLLDALGRYDDLSGRAAYADEQVPDRLAGHPPRAALAMNVQAGEVMRDQLLPAATALADAYQRRAADREKRVRGAALRWAAAVAVLGAAALGFLLWWQRELARDYRRLFNPALVAATAAVLVVTAWGTPALAGAADAVTAAGRDGLRPWTRLVQARAVAAQAAATESRWFVHDPSFGAGDQARFTALTGELDTLLAPTGDGAAGELPGSADVLARYRHFRADDRRLRALKAAGDTDAAAAVLTEVGRGDVAFDFWDFATALDGLADRRLADFTAHATDARTGLTGWPALPAAALGAAGMLVLLGVRPRLAEYH